MSDRSARAEIRNPILGLPSASLLKCLDHQSKAALRGVLLELRADAQVRAEQCWRKHKAPMAAYWKAVAVYAGHIARVLNLPPSS